MVWSAARSRPRGFGLAAAGTRCAAGICLVPRETIAALGEDIAWLKDQIAGPHGTE